MTGSCEMEITAHDTQHPGPLLEGAFSASSPKKICPPLLWLNVDGAPRSGTTALMNLLNRSADIFIFHELVEHDLGVAIKPVHALTERFRQYRNTGEHSAHLLDEQNTNAMFLSFLAYSASGKFPKVIGTKDPESVLHPTAPISTQLSRKTIHITRSPIGVLNSALKRVKASVSGGDAFASDEKSALLRSAGLCIRNWNNACLHVTSPNFLHLFYEDIGKDPRTASNDVNAFLGTHDVTLDEWYAPSTKPDIDAFLGSCAEMLGPEAGIITQSGLIFDWDDRAERLRNRRFISPPVAMHTPVSFARGGSGWIYQLDGFSTSSTPEGTWIENENSSLAFSLPRNATPYEVEFIFSKIILPPGAASVVLTVHDVRQTVQYTFSPNTPAPAVTFTLKADQDQGGQNYSATRLFIYLVALNENREKMLLPNRTLRAMLNGMIIRR